jgi:tetratricopeptide (TPR) repeat protein/NAD-dependent dihydropyrimidine dehydrogenase PreA subunit
LIALNLLMIGHYIQWRLTGTTVSPIEPSETMYTLQNGAVNAGFIFFILAIIATLIIGRFVCGWGCQILALQDLCDWFLNKIGLKPRPFRSRLLVFVPLIAGLYMFVWPNVIGALTKPAGVPLIPGFTNHLVTAEFWSTFPPFWLAVPFLFICGFMTVYFLGSKGFCTYACPYGGLFGVADKLAPGRIRVTDACNECGHCTATCTSNVIVHQEVKQYGMVVDPGCMKCMDCVSICPNDALYFGFGKRAVSVKKTIERNYSLTWSEEIAAAAVFLASYLAIWDVYQLIPMLMSLGIAAVTTFLAMRAWKLYKTADLTFYRYSLKSGGVIKNAGWIFIFFATIWIGLNAHSGWIRYHEYVGGQAFRWLQIPDELALASEDPQRWISESDQQNIREGKRHLSVALQNGFITNADALQKLAWFEQLSGNGNQAVELLSKAAGKQDGPARALSHYYEGSIQNRQGRFEEAIQLLDQALLERSDLTAAREEKGESLWQLARRDEAIAEWERAVSENDRLVIANSFLAGAYFDSDPAKTAAFESEAAKNSPDDPLFHWMVGIRLENIGMRALAEKHFARAIELDPDFRRARN